MRRQVFFKVLKIEDTRKHGSILTIGATYRGVLNEINNSVEWVDSGSYQYWTFYVGDTCEIANR